MDTLNEWCYRQRAKTPIHHAISTHAWTKPSVGTIKGNIDVAAFNNNSVIEYGTCFCDSTSTFLLGKSDFYYSSATILEAESLGLLNAVKVIISNGMHDVLFKTNLKLMSDSLNSNSSPSNEFGDLVIQCRSLLFNRPNFAMSYVRRQTNGVAHSIATTSLSHPSPFIFHHLMPTLYSLILNEMK
jgi:hypothetical protein